MERWQVKCHWTERRQRQHLLFPAMTQTQTSLTQMTQTSLTAQTCHHNIIHKSADCTPQADCTATEQKGDSCKPLVLWNDHWLLSNNITPSGSHQAECSVTEQKGRVCKYLEAWMKNITGYLNQYNTFSQSWNRVRYNRPFATVLFFNRLVLRPLISGKTSMPDTVDSVVTCIFLFV